MPKRPTAPARANATSTSTEAVLSTRALNRALLARQLLLQRDSMPVADAIEHLVGLQAQVPTDPYYALWSRLEGFQPAALGELISNRRAVRIAVMRATIHLVTARDCLAMWPVVHPVHVRTLHSNSQYGKRIAGIDLDELLAIGRATLEERPITLAQLRLRLSERWPEYDAESMARAVHYLLPLVQVPPRGVWGKGGRATCTTAEAWIGQPLEAGTTPDALMLRYLAAFGPAGVADMRTWSGLTGLNDVVERLRPDLLTFRDEAGRELLDLPVAPRPDEDTPAPLRFLPEYDNVMLSHAGRTRIVTDEHRRSLMSANGVGPGTVLVDGFVGATWRITREKRTATLRIRLLVPLSEHDHAALAEEAERLLDFAAAEASIRDVQIETVPQSPGTHVTPASLRGLHHRTDFVSP